MAYFLLGERMKKVDYFALIAVFASVCLVILGAAPVDSTKDDSALDED